jgi:hypothetical protein
MKISILLPSLLAIIGCLPQQLLAMYLPVETQDVPLERLIGNIVEKAKAEPTNAEALHQLARIHAIAYSNKLGDADPVKSWTGWQKKDPEQPWLGYQPPHAPYHMVTKTEDEKKLEAAKAHLATAIETYKKALAAKPDDTTIMLGFAWCQDQAGKKEAAIAGYRKVAAAAWEKESKSDGGFGNFLYVETAGYLMPLLDPAKDAAEIAGLKKNSEMLRALPRAVTPIAIPLTGMVSGPDALIDQSARVRFDLDGTGRQLEWQWITRDAAWLVFDPRQTGKITSSIQMFGNRSFLLFCSDGYQSLALLDDDGNGSISGSELSGLALWNDINSDGISDPGEVKPVSEHGITSLSTSSRIHSSGMPYSAAGATFEEGSARPTFDLILKSK